MSGGRLTVVTSAERKLLAEAVDQWLELYAGVTPEERRRRVRMQLLRAELCDTCDGSGCPTCDPCRELTCDSVLHRHNRVGATRG